MIDVLINKFESKLKMQGYSPSDKSWFKYFIEELKELKSEPKEQLQPSKDFKQTVRHLYEKWSNNPNVKNYTPLTFLEYMLEQSEQLQPQPLKQHLISLQHKEDAAMSDEKSSDRQRGIAYNRFMSLTHVLEMIADYPTEQLQPQQSLADIEEIAMIACGQNYGYRYEGYKQALIDHHLPKLQPQQAEP